MSIQRPLSAVFYATMREHLQRDQPRNEQKKRWRKKVTVVLVRCLALLILITLPASMGSLRPKPARSPAPFVPVGEVAIVTAPGFDTCIAPPASLLKTWWEKSPYRWLNIYLGGVSMYPTCGGKNLTQQWVRTVYNQGWSLLPTWVGLQAPCAPQHNVMSRDLAVSYVQGQFEAASAIKAADRLGFSSTSPIYFDMEHFNPTRRNGSIDHSCIEAVNAFLEGWNYELGSHNRLAGVYASASNYPALGKSNMAESLFAWIAGGSSWAQRYDQACSVFGNKYVSDVSWNSHQRIYQYTGGHKETYGRHTWNIDSNCADAPMVGHVKADPIVVQFQLF